MSDKQTMRVRAGQRAADRANRRENPPRPRRSRTATAARRQARRWGRAEKERARLAGTKLKPGDLAVPRRRTRTNRKAG